jgi:Tol biopolymer transport system component/predicted Ser/Thr protein kinase
MPLSRGDRLGPYEIGSPIGAGGMGEVYKARDTRLDRIVALKVSKAEFTERFSREARTVAQLNHPHICTMYDVGPNYLVMEFVDGAPLVSDTKPGPMPVEKALEYAGQILDALDAAHRKGIVHRDLKPANILVTKQGIKLLDFGLAKQTVELGPDDVTIAPATGEGQLSGTLQYMSPEQLEGKPADARSDIFAFGLILYELIAAKRPFTGASPASVIASILKEEPRPLHELQPLTPPGLERVIRKCLEKDRDERWQSARDVKYALEWMAQQAAPSAITAAAPGKKLRLWQALAAMSIPIALGLAGWMFRPKAEPAAQIIRFQAPLPEGALGYNLPLLSPDGRKLVIADLGAQANLWIRDLDTLEWRRLPGTDGARPFWSPDSRYLGFISQNQLKKVDVSGGAAQTLCTLSTDNNVGSGAWNRDGVIVFASGGGLWKISQANCVATALTAVDTVRGETFHFVPTFMPDGKHFVYLRHGSPEVSGIYAGSLDAKPAEQSRERIQASQFTASYVNGYLFFMRETTLMAQPLDAGRLQLRGEPVPVAEHLGSAGPFGFFSVSANGTLVWRGEQNASHQLTWFDREGKILSTFGQPGTDQHMVLSPDGTRAAVRDADINGNSAGDLWTLDFARGVRTRFTFRRTSGSAGPVWSPDGSRIAFAAGNQYDTLYEKASSGAGDEKELLKEPGKAHIPTSWSRDGGFLLYTATAGKSGNDLGVLPLEGGRKPVVLLATQFNEGGASFSPDMRWIAYESDESGRFEIYVRPFLAHPESDKTPSGAPSLGEGKWQVSRDGGDSPKWRADGREIIFQAPPYGTAKMAVDVKANGAALEIGVPQRLFQAPIDYGWDVTPDGKRFLLAVPQGQQSAPVTVELNWPALLKKK